MDYESAFAKRVRHLLGERAHHHVGSIASRKPDIGRLLEDKCTRALVFKGRHYTVQNKNEFIGGIKTALEMPGVLLCFFSWEGFKVVVFVDDEEFRMDEFEAVATDEAFRTKYVDLDMAAYSDINMAD